MRLISEIIMKNKLLKILFAILAVPAVSFFYFGLFSAQASSDKLNVTFSGLTRNDTATYQVMPRDTFQIIVENLSDKKMELQFYLYPLSDKDNFISYPFLSVFEIEAGNMSEQNITIPNDKPTGDYRIRVRSYMKNDEGGIVALVYDDTDLFIRTDGIIINPNDGGYNPTKVVKGQRADFKIKFYNLAGVKFSIFIDTDAHIRRKDISVPSDEEYIYKDFSWQTNEGTTIGPHKIIVKTDTGIKEEFSLTVTDPSDPGGDDDGAGGSAGFNIKERLNNFNIKKLLDSCKEKKDLDGILCLVDKVILWLLDIGAVISFIMILYASIIYLTSYGDESKAELAKKTLVWSVVGVIVIGVAWSIMKIIENIFNA